MARERADSFRGEVGVDVRPSLNVTIAMQPLLATEADRGRICEHVWKVRGHAAAVAASSGERPMGATAAALNRLMVVVVGS